MVLWKRERARRHCTRVPGRVGTRQQVARAQRLVLASNKVPLITPQSPPTDANQHHDEQAETHAPDHLHSSRSAHAGEVRTIRQAG